MWPVIPSHVQCPWRIRLWAVPRRLYTSTSRRYPPSPLLSDLTLHYLFSPKPRSQTTTTCAMPAIPSDPIPTLTRSKSAIFAFLGSLNRLPLQPEVDHLHEMKPDDQRRVLDFIDEVRKGSSLLKSSFINCTRLFLLSTRKLWTTSASWAKYATKFICFRLRQLSPT